MKKTLDIKSFNNKNDKLIAACTLSDPAAQRLLIQQYFGYVKSICMRYSSSNQDADEIINDTFLKVFSNLDKYDVNQPFKGWIRTIAINTAIDHYRKNLKQPFFDSIDNLQIYDINHDIINSISVEEILSMVRELSPMYRMVFSMFVIDGYSHKEIAEKLGIKEGTSKSNLQDARKKLQSLILKRNPALFFAYDVKNSTHDNE